MSFHYTKKDYSLYYVILFVVLGTAINFLCSFLVTPLNVPLYLDTIGTIFVAIVCGGLPGIITGILTNIIVNIFVGGYLYFSIINVFVALLASRFARYKSGGKLYRAILFVIYTSLMCAVLGMGIQYILPGLPMLSNLKEVSESISSGSGLPYYAALTFVSFFLNIVDKGLSLVVALIIVKIIPSSLREQLLNFGWKQKPIPIQELKESAYYKKKSTLLRKVSLLLFLIIVILSFILIWISISFYMEDCKEEYTDEAFSVVESAAMVVDGDVINDYVKWGNAASGYRVTEKYLNMLLNNTQGVERLCVFIAENNGYYYVFQEAKPGLEVYENGKVIPYNYDYPEYIEAFKKGEAIDEIIVYDNGNLLMATYPIKNTQGETVCYAVAEVYMSFLSDYTREYLIKTFLCFSGFIVAILILGFTVAGYNLVFPINSITEAAGHFLNSHGDQKALDENVKKSRALGIRTHDEVQELYVALCEMEAETAEYVRDIKHYAETTKKMQNGLIITLAGIVENRGYGSNVNVQVTSDYVRIILNGLKNKGYYPEKISDEYMEEIEMSAPLHDIGKIHIPDAILNKNDSDLSEEENEIMKKHVIYGREIMEKAIDTVKGDTNLKEARNMAAYHHERWDGKGYPEGLHGEVIPLSARIMALADELDELTTPKRFKITYSLDEAFEMIQAESGKKFDPKCVEALLESKNEIRGILNNISIRRY